MVLIGCAALAAFFLILIPRCSESIGGLFGSSQNLHQQNENVVVAKLSGFNGEVQIKSKSEVDFRKVDSAHLPISIKNLDQLTIGESSSADLEFLSGDHLNFMQNSDVIFEAWNPEAGGNNPVYLHILQGEYELVQAGQEGQLFIVQGERFFYPSQEHLESAPLIKVESSSLPKKAVKVIEPLVEDETSEEKAKVKDLVDVANLSSDEQDSAEASLSQTTLTNEYIDSKISRQKGLFSNCQGHAVKTNQAAEGKIMVGFKILPSGQTNEVQVLSSQLNNEQLSQCVLDVFRRVRFKPFEGETIHRAYPLEFSKEASL